jgi:cellulase (glycosyl hydrolase family 5)
MGQGLTLVGAVAPAWCSKRDPTGPAAVAAAHLTAAEMATYKNTWHVNLIRFQVSQPGLATVTSGQISAYLTQIKSAVAKAEAEGFGVILSMQDQSIACGNADPLPSVDTVTAWDNLAPVFASDPNVMYEIFNEPTNTTSTAAWNQWKWDSCTPIPCPSSWPPGQTWIGHQRLIDDIRALGAPNVVLVDGALHASTFTNVPLLHDVSPGKGIVYAVHPYGVHTPATEQPLYGTWLTSQVPVLATEWNYQQCKLGPTPEMAWWKSLHIGLTGWSGDIPGTIINTWKYDPTSCSTGTKWAGGSSLLKDFGG